VAEGDSFPKPAHVSQIFVGIQVESLNGALANDGQIAGKIIGGLAIASIALLILRFIKRPELQEETEQEAPKRRSHQEFQGEAEEEAPKRRSPQKLQEEVTIGSNEMEKKRLKKAPKGSSRSHNNPRAVSRFDCLSNLAFHQAIRAPRRSPKKKSQVESASRLTLAGTAVHASCGFETDNSERDPA
jgi:hypothetical protein